MFLLLLLPVAGWIIFAFGSAQFLLWGWWYMHKNDQGSFSKVINVTPLHRSLIFMSRSFSQTFMASLRPNDKWGPANPKIRRDWIIFKSDLAAKRAAAASTNKFGFFRQKLSNLCGNSF